MLDCSSRAVSLPVQSLGALCLRHDELGLNDALWTSPDGVFHFSSHNEVVIFRCFS